MLGACDEAERPYAKIFVNDVVAIALFFEIVVVVRQSDLLDSYALGFVAGVRLRLRRDAMFGGIGWEKAGEEPGHTAAEGRHTGT